MDGHWFVPVYCANCGVSQGLVSEEHTTFAFMLCEKCVEVHGAPANFTAVPDEVFWQRVADAEKEKYGRCLTAAEECVALDDVNGTLSKLAREKPRGLK